MVDTWWQTETGGIMLTPLPGDKDAKPGAAMRPFYGVRVEYPEYPSVTWSRSSDLAGFAPAK